MVPTSILACALVAPALGAPRDEYQYLHTRCNVDGFLPAGDFDGARDAYPPELLPEGRVIHARSARFGRVAFLRPRTDGSDENFIACRGQTIPIRTQGRFNLLFVLGAAHHGDHVGEIAVRFADGTRVRSSLGLSDWFEDPAFSEEVAWQAPFRPSEGGAVDEAGPPVTLWLQWVLLPADRKPTSVTLPGVPQMKIAGLTLGRREGFAWPEEPAPALPDAAPVAVFAEPGFPAYNGDQRLTPDRVQDALGQAGLDAAFLRVDHLRDPAVLRPDRYPVLILPYGNSFPAEALDTLRAYRRDGGATVYSGIPFTHAVRRGPHGTWYDAGHTEEHAAPGATARLGSGWFRNAPVSRLTATDRLREWGLGDLPWDEIRPGAHLQSGGQVQVLELASLPEGSEVHALVTVNGALNAPWTAIIRHKEGPEEGAIDVWTGHTALWRGEEGPLTRLHATLMARAAAWCLHELGQLSDEAWERASEPLAAEDMTYPPPRPVVPDEVAPASFPRREIDTSTVHRVAVEGLAPEDRVLLASAQGLLHREGVTALALVASGGDPAWIEHLQATGRVDEIETNDLAGALDLVGHRRAVVVDPALYGSLHVATALAALDGLLIAWPAHVARHELEVAEDLRGRFADGREQLAWCLEELAPRMRSGLVAHYPPVAEAWELRDYLIAHRILPVWLPAPRERSAPGVRPAAERLLLEEFLARRPVGTPAIGALGEGDVFGPSDAGVAWLSRHGLPFEELDGAANLTLSSAMPPPEPRPEPPEPRSMEPPELEIEPDTVYVAASDVRATTERARAVHARLARDPSTPRPGLASDALPRSLLGAASSRAAETLFPHETAWLLAERELPRPTGSTGPGRIDAASFGAAFGPGRTDAVRALLARERADLAARGRIWTELDADRLTRGIDATELGELLGPDNVFYADATGPHALPLGAFRSVGDALVLPRYPRFGVLHFSTSGSASGSAGSGVRVNVLHPGFVLAGRAGLDLLLLARRSGERVEVLRPAELFALARRFARTHRLEEVELVAAGSRWRYHDRGEDLGTAWRAPDYDDADWPEGEAELGYGDDAEGRPEATTLDYGGDANAKHPCYYFRKSFELGDVRPASLRLELVFDDGCVVWLNGERCTQRNMRPLRTSASGAATGAGTPEGEIPYGARARQTVGGDDEDTWQSVPLSPDRLRPGRNVLAVEVHQAAPTSSDLSFDLRLSGDRWIERPTGESE